jgi:putative two-component system response regulator
MHRIMVVDDEAVITMQLEERLTAMGYEVVGRASSGEASLDMARRFRPDLILMDIVMPGRLDGIDAAQAIKANLDIPVIFLTAYAHDKFVNRAKRVEPFGYIVKPFQENEIKAAIEVALHKKDMERRLRKAEEEYRSERKRAEEELRQNCTKLQKTLDGTIHAWVSVTEARDPYTADHQRGVAQLACAIANEMGLPEEQIEGIRVAGLIHDIGKLNVPLEVLSKPTGLTEFERDMIKAHPQVGYDILKTVEFPSPVAQIVLQHHERLDGSGYPQGLSGEEIILEAKILAVADVVKTMSSHRPSGGPWGLDKALEEISQNRGVLYDSQAVDACLKLFSEKRFTFE